MVMLYNHLEFIVEVSETYNDGQRIVGFEVEPKSISADGTGVQYLKANETVNFSFNVSTKRGASTWATRYDHYLKFGSSKKVHLANIIMSILVIAILTVIVARILRNSLKNDFRNIEMSIAKRTRSRRGNVDEAE